eukprot:357162-Chlamydomonas_euryale.AAC.7
MLVSVSKVPKPLAQCCSWLWLPMSTATSLAYLLKSLRWPQPAGCTAGGRHRCGSCNNTNNNFSKESNTKRTHRECRRTDQSSATANVIAVAKCVGTHCCVSDRDNPDTGKPHTCQKPARGESRYLRVEFCTCLCGILDHNLVRRRREPESLPATNVRAVKPLFVVLSYAVGTPTASN